MAVTQQDIQAVLGLVVSAQGIYPAYLGGKTSAEKQAYKSQVDNLLRNASTLAEKVGGGLRQEGKTREGGYIDAVFLETWQATQGQENYDFTRWTKLLKDAIAGLAAVSQLTAAQSAANAEPISKAQTSLAAKILDTGQTPKTSAVLQTEWARISSLIRNATLLKSDRDRLLAKQQSLLTSVGEHVAASSASTTATTPTASVAPTTATSSGSWFDFFKTPPSPAPTPAPTTTSKTVASAVSNTVVATQKAATASTGPTSAQQFQQFATGLSAALNPLAQGLSAGGLSIQPIETKGPRVIQMQQTKSNTGLILGVIGGATLLTVLVLILRR